MDRYEKAKIAGGQLIDAHVSSEQLESVAGFGETSLVSAEMLKRLFNQPKDYSSREEYAKDRDVLKKKIISQGNDPDEVVIFILVTQDIFPLLPETFEGYPVYVIRASGSSSCCGNCGDDDCSKDDGCGDDCCCKH